MKHFKKSKLTRPGHSQPRMSFLVKLLDGIGLKILTSSKAFLANPSWAFKLLIALKFQKLSLDSGTEWLSAPFLMKNQPDPKTLSQNNTIFLPRTGEYRRCLLNQRFHLCLIQLHRLSFSSWVLLNTFKNRESFWRCYIPCNSSPDGSRCANCITGVGKSAAWRRSDSIASQSQL